MNTFLNRNTMKESRQTGFVLLYAVLISSIVLVIGLTLSSIIYKQLIISSISREMNQGYYAANSVRECVRFLRATEFDIFGTNAPAVLPKVSCADLTGTVTTNFYYDVFSKDFSRSSGGANTDLQLGYMVTQSGSSRPLCGIAEVGKNAATNDTVGVTASGYNLSCNDASLGRFTARSVERILCTAFDTIAYQGACSELR